MGQSQSNQISSQHYQKQYQTGMNIDFLENPNGINQEFKRPLQNLTPQLTNYNISNIGCIKTVNTPQRSKNLQPSFSFSPLAQTQTLKQENQPQMCIRSTTPKARVVQSYQQNLDISETPKNEQRIQFIQPYQKDYVKHYKTIDRYPNINSLSQSNLNKVKLDRSSPNQIKMNKSSHQFSDFNLKRSIDDKNKIEIRLNNIKDIQAKDIQQLGHIFQTNVQEKTNLKLQQQSFQRNNNHIIITFSLDEQVQKQQYTRNSSGSLDKNLESIYNDSLNSIARLQQNSIGESKEQILQKNESNFSFQKKYNEMHHNYDPSMGDDLNTLTEKTQNTILQMEHLLNQLKEAQQVQIKNSSYFNPKPKDQKLIKIQESEISPKQSFLYENDQLFALNDSQDQQIKPISRKSSQNHSKPNVFQNEDNSTQNNQIKQKLQQNFQRSNNQNDITKIKQQNMNMTEIENKIQELLQSIENDGCDKRNGPLQDCENNMFSYKLGKKQKLNCEKKSKNKYKNFNSKKNNINPLNEIPENNLKKEFLSNKTTNYTILDDKRYEKSQKLTLTSLKDQLEMQNGKQKKNNKKQIV